MENAESNFCARSLVLEQAGFKCVYLRINPIRYTRQIFKLNSLGNEFSSLILARMKFPTQFYYSWFSFYSQPRNYDHWNRKIWILSTLLWMFTPRWYFSIRTVINIQKTIKEMKKTSLFSGLLSIRTVIRQLRYLNVRNKLSQQRTGWHINHIKEKKEKNLRDWETSTSESSSSIRQLDNDSQKPR